MRDRDELLARLDLGGLIRELLPDAKPAGKNKMLARCPWGERHKNNDASPSFLTFPLDGDFKCQACGEKGSIFDLYGKIHGHDYHGSIKALAKRVGLQSHKVQRRITGSYVYHDSSYKPLYWKERVEPDLDGKAKGFYFFHGSGAEPGKAFFMPKDSREKGRGCDPVLYRLPAVLRGHRIYFTEGEKQADLLCSWNLTATTLDSGCGSTLTQTMIHQLQGKEIVIFPDNDPQGRLYGDHIARSLQGVASWVKVVELNDLPPGGDIVDWACNPSNDVNSLLKIVEETGYYLEGDPRMDKAEGLPHVRQSEPETRIVEQRAFPRLYFDLARHFDDSRRFYFRKGHATVFDSFVMRIAKSSGAQFPYNLASIARLLESDEDTVKEMLETALQHGMLVLNNGYLSNPMITEQYNNALIKCQTNAMSGAKGGKSVLTKRSKSIKK